MIDLANGLTVGDLLTLVGNAVVVSIIVELVKRTLAMTDDQISRFGPALACGSGIVLGVLAAIFLVTDPVQGALTGLLGGALAAGLYTVVGERLGILVEQLTRGRVT